MTNIDKRIRKLVERIDAEKVVVAITFDKDSWWKRRGKGRLPFGVDIEWEDGDEKFHADGHVTGASIGAVLNTVEAQVDGILLRRRAGTTDDD